MATPDEEDADDAEELGLDWYRWNLHRRTARRWYRLGRQVFYGVMACHGYHPYAERVPKKVLRRASAAEEKMYAALHTGQFQIRTCDR